MVLQGLRSGELTLPGFVHGDEDPGRSELEREVAVLVDLDIPELVGQQTPDLLLDRGGKLRVHGGGKNEAERRTSNAEWKKQTSDAR